MMAFRREPTFARLRTSASSNLKTWVGKLSCTTLRVVISATRASLNLGLTPKLRLDDALVKRISVCNSILFVVALLLCRDAFGQGYTLPWADKNLPLEVRGRQLSAQTSLFSLQVAHSVQLESLQVKLSSGCRKPLVSILLTRAKEHSDNLNNLKSSLRSKKILRMNFPLLHCKSIRRRSGRPKKNWLRPSKRNWTQLNWIDF